jgi:hypothetical protein
MMELLHPVLDRASCWWVAASTDLAALEASGPAAWAAAMITRGLVCVRPRKGGGGTLHPHVTDGEIEALGEVDSCLHGCSLSEVCTQCPHSVVV